MSEDSLASRERRFQSTVDVHLPRNIAAQLANGALGQTGFRLVQAPTFLPAFLFSLTGSEFLVGLARSLQAGGMVLSPIIGASLIGHRERILSTTLVIGVLMRGQILGLSAAAFLLGNGSAFAAVVLFMTLMGVFQGMSQVTMNSLRAKVIPVRRRGVVSGFRNFLAGGTSATVAYFAGAYVIEPDLLGNGYGALFLLAFALGLLGLAGLALTREPVAVSVRAREGPRETWHQIPQLLRSNRHFARFFASRALAAFGRMAMPFYILFAQTRIELSGSDLGLVTTVWMVASSIATLMWGVIADRRGYRLVMILTLGVWSLAQLQMLTVDGMAPLIGFFLMLGMAQSGFVQASQNMLFELGAEKDVPLRLAASGTAVNAIATVGPVLAGAIVTFASYEALFVTCFVLQALALVVLVRLVPEPRHLDRDSGTEAS
ncbi:MAG: MFS transporter [Gammaproteobacteria bacterium]